MNKIYLVMSGSVEGDVIHWCPYIAVKTEQRADEIAYELLLRQKQICSGIEVCIRTIELVD